MNRKSIVHLLSILLFTSCFHYNKTKNNIIAQHNEMAATEFSLSIIEAYFSEDCDKVLNAMSDSVLIMDGDGIFSTTDHEDQLCQSIKKAITNKEKTMENYLETYKFDVLTTVELEQKFETKLPEYFTVTDSDYFFIGFEFKEGKGMTEVDDFYLG